MQGKRGRWWGGEEERRGWQGGRDGEKHGGNLLCKSGKRILGKIMRFKIFKSSLMHLCVH